MASQNSAGNTAATSRAGKTLFGRFWPFGCWMVAQETHGCNTTKVVNETKVRDPEVKKDVLK